MNKEPSNSPLHGLELCKAFDKALAEWRAQPVRYIRPVQASELTPIGPWRNNVQPSQKGREGE